MADPERPQVVLVNRCLVYDPKGKVLLVQRSSTDDNNPSKWEFPGGKLDKGQVVSGALEREVIEETGLLVEPISRLAYWESYIIPGGKYPGATYVALFGIATVIGGKMKLDPEEHQAHAWVSPESALDYDLTLESRKALIVLAGLGDTALRQNQD